MIIIFLESVKNIHLLELGAVGILTGVRGIKEPVQRFPLPVEEN